MPGKAGAIRAGQAYVELGVREKLIRGLNRASAKLRSFSRGVGTIGAGLMTASGAILAPLGAAIQQFKTVGDTLDKVSKRTGISVEALSELGFAAEQSGSDIGILEKGIKGMQRSVNDLGRGLSTQIDAFGNLGLAMSDLEGRTPEDQFSLIADRLSQIHDPGKRAALAMQIFGRAGQQLLPMLAGGAAGIDALRDRARELGLTVSSVAAESAADLTDRMNEMWRVAKRGVFAIGGALAPMVTDLIKRITDASITILKWIKENKEVVVWAAKMAVAIGAAGTALVALAAAGMAVSFVVSGMATILGVAGAVIGAIASPIGIAVAALAGLGLALYRAWNSGAIDGLIDGLKEIGAAAGAAIQHFGEWSGLTKIFGAIWSPLRDLGGIFTTTFQGVRDAIVTGDWEAVGMIVMAGLEAAWLSGVTTLKEIWGNLKVAMIEAFAGVVVAVHKMWTELQNKISTTLIEWTTRKDVVGKAARFVTGFDPRKMRAQSERHARAGSEAKVEQWGRMRAEALKAGEDAKAKEIEGWIAREKKKLATGDFGTGMEILLDVKAEVKGEILRGEQIEQMREQVKALKDELGALELPKPVKVEIATKREKFEALKAELSELKPSDTVTIDVTAKRADLAELEDELARLEAPQPVTMEIETKRGELANLTEELAKLEAAGPIDLEVKRAQLADIEAKLAAGGFTGRAEWDPVAETQKIIDDATAAAQDGVADYWAGVTREQRQKADQAAEEARRRADAARGKLTDLAAAESDDRAVKEQEDKWSKWWADRIEAFAEFGDRLKEAVDKAGEAVDVETTTRGAFSAAAVARMGGRSVEDEQLEQQKKIAKNTEAIARKPELAFAP